MQKKKMVTCTYNTQSNIHIFLHRLQTVRPAFTINRYFHHEYKKSNLEQKHNINNVSDNFLYRIRAPSVL